MTVGWMIFALQAADAVDALERFESKVRPVLASNCFACHTRSKLGGLAVDSRAALLQGGKSGPAVVPGDPEKSLLIQAVRHTHATLKMPPTARLKDAEVEQLEAWVREGAPWPEAKAPKAGHSGLEVTPEQRGFWSFQPVRKPMPPAVRNTAWPRGSIDRFVLAKLEEKGLQPAAEADRRTWIRRVTYGLIGLPPTPEEVARFVADPAADAYDKVVDRLLASPRYGERWARHWLDVARYGDDALDTQLGVQPMFYPYRDWVIRAFNEDMPYDLFVKAQFAGDLLPGQDTRKLLPALTVFMNSPSEFADDDRVDVATRGFLGLTVACAQCHDHKYDPIPTKDYYSLLGIFRSTQYREVALDSAEKVADYKAHKDAVDEQKREVEEFVETARRQVIQVLAGNTYGYLMAAWRGGAATDGLDAEVLERWKRYLAKPGKQHGFLRQWEKLVASHASEAEVDREARAFHELVLRVLRDKKAIDDHNKMISYGARLGRDLNDVVGKTMSRERYMLWQELAAVGNPKASTARPSAREDGVLMFPGDTVFRFLPGSYRTHVERMRKRQQQLTAEMPPAYPYLTILEDSPKPANLRVSIRGNPQNPGEEAPRAFLTVFRDLFPQTYTKGSGRLELAEAMASPKNPLTARVMVNRVWERHFGHGLVRTPSNFGQTGDRPVHPELLDYLASRFMEQGWSLKKLHREIVLSAAYREGTAKVDANFAVDPDNRLHWRFNRRRLEAEALRDTILAVSGQFDDAMGGRPVPLDSATNYRRSVYGRISRNVLDPMLTLFDFPNPNVTSEQRIPTTVAPQRLFLLNSPFVMDQGVKLARRLQGTEPARIEQAYQLLFQRAPSAAELASGLKFVAEGEAAWARYCQVLLSTNEFLYLD